MGLKFIGARFDRQLRNSLAHAQFEIDSDGTLIHWNHADRNESRSLSEDELVTRFNTITDLAVASSMLFLHCTSRAFLEAVSIAKRKT